MRQRRKRAYMVAFGRENRPRRRRVYTVGFGNARIPRKWYLIYLAVLAGLGLLLELIQRIENWRVAR